MNGGRDASLLSGAGRDGFRLEEASGGWKTRRVVDLASR